MVIIIIIIIIRLLSPLLSLAKAREGTSASQRQEAITLAKLQ
jgi:hypothetical protein